MFGGQQGLPVAAIALLLTFNKIKVLRPTKLVLIAPPFSYTYPLKLDYINPFPHFNACVLNVSITNGGTPVMSFFTCQC